MNRILDIAVASLTLIALSPLIVLIILGIKALSRGPAFFKQERIGYRGKAFMCLKFRTMHVGANDSEHKDHSLRLISSNSALSKLDELGDSRLIPFAWILRASGFDELPQLINVLKGEMSIVGPRPCVRFEYEEYNNWQKNRFNALPGLTGLWQVSGKNITNFNQMILMDIQYANEKSVIKDLKIMLMTLPILIMQTIEIGIGRRKTEKAADRMRMIRQS